MWKSYLEDRELSDGGKNVLIFAALVSVGIIVLYSMPFIGIEAAGSEVIIFVYFFGPFVAAIFGTIFVTIVISHPKKSNWHRGKTFMERTVLLVWLLLVGLIYIFFNMGIGVNDFLWEALLTKS